MNTKFVSFMTEDNVLLQGNLFSREGANKAVIHIHGLAGNFYENTFLLPLAEKLVSKDFAFLTFNNRGHDYISDYLVKTNGNWESKKGGGAFEIFEDCIKDISAAITFMKKNGYSKIYMQGHSSGTNKAIFHQFHAQKSTLANGLILLSPTDDIGLQQVTKEEDYPRLLSLAEKMVKEGNGEGLMPEGTFFSYPISARTYLDYFGSDNKRDIFPYRDPESEFTEVSKINVPIFALFGNDGEYVIGDISETLNLLETKAKKCPSIEKYILDGAPHNYLGKEFELADVVVSWLESVQ